MALISIALSTYNRPEYLKGLTVHSLLSQSFKDWECVIAGDGVEPQVDADLKSFFDNLNDPRFKYFNCHAPNYRDQPIDIGSPTWNIAGVDALNEALKKCSGKYLFRLDDDDLWAPNHLETYLQIFADKQPDVINSVAHFHQYDKYLGLFGERFDATKMLAGQNHLFHSTVAWDASKIGFEPYSNDPVLPADLQQWMKFATMGYSWELNPAITVTYLQRCSLDYSLGHR